MDKATELAYVVIAGISAQVIIALAYKLSTAWEYHANLDPSFKEKKRYKFAKCLNELYVLEVSFDVFTAICYVYGTYGLVQLSFLPVT